MSFLESSLMNDDRINLYLCRNFEEILRMCFFKMVEREVGWLIACKKTVASSSTIISRAKHAR